jgi:hypothetical protein
VLQLDSITAFTHACHAQQALLTKHADATHASRACVDACYRMLHTPAGMCHTHLPDAHLWHMASPAHLYVHWGHCGCTLGGAVGAGGSGGGGWNWRQPQYLQVTATRGTTAGHTGVTGWHHTLAGACSFQLVATSSPHRRASAARLQSHPPTSTWTRKYMPTPTWPPCPGQQQGCQHLQALLLMLLLLLLS